MQRICQKIVRVQNGLITEIYDGLRYRSFQDNDRALKELLMDDVGLDFESILNTYESLIHDLANSFPHLRDYISQKLPDGWLQWSQQNYEEESLQPTTASKAAARISDTNSPCIP
ncbi:hypothetical protein [Paenibacillus sp. UNC451MF]|uniref:hypothetical protein n=1 Tax=Paenibacillus sp. UNC451MF TaxID=1449063 RepID=UPI000690F339|nr:hypothetical protein [Paenibacillus sp. UNC451MF]